MTSYDKHLSEMIIKKSMKQVGCIIPYIPHKYSQGYEVCEDPSKAQKAFDIFTDLVKYNDLELHPCSFIQSKITLVQSEEMEYPFNTTMDAIETTFRYHSKTMVVFITKKI